MNYLSIDYGTKQIGLAYSVSGIIFTLPPIKNDSYTFYSILNLINTYSIGKIYVGLSTGKLAELSKKFVDQLSPVVKLPIETVEETASTLEAAEIFHTNKNKKKNYKKTVDSLAAAVILRRVISFT